MCLALRAFDATEELHPTSMYGGLIQPNTNRSPHSCGPGDIGTLTGRLYRLIPLLVGILLLLISTAGSRAGCCAMQHYEVAVVE